MSAAAESGGNDFTLSISQNQINAAREVFKRFDKKNNETISINDVAEAFRSLSLVVKPDTLKDWAEDVDEDGTGQVDFEGFLFLYDKKLKEDADIRELKAAFRVLDKNKKGEIDVEDLRWILRSIGEDLSEEDIDDMIRDTDTDGSGTVDFDEFYTLMTSD